ncbi:MAG: hypothetical protein WD557_00995 [Dehalococcoidia bacterium]
MTDVVKDFLRSVRIEYRVWLAIIAAAALVFLAMGDYFLWWVSAGCFAAIVGRCWLQWRRQSRPGAYDRRP